MKKIMYLMMGIIMIYILNPIISFANDEPLYVPTFNRNEGALYAKGNDIVIDIDEDNNTIVKWSTGSVKVPETVTIFGGGPSSSYNETNITMNGGKVYRIIGAGWGNLNDASKDKVNETHITINGGTVTDCIAGGGCIYSETQSANIVVNGGSIKTIVGGGLEALEMDGIKFDAGSEQDLKNSGNRVIKANIVINDIEKTQDAAIFAGGYEYAYVGETTLTIKGGDMSDTHVVAGGEDGYTVKSEVIIEGGTIGSYQSLSKGIVEEVITKVINGQIDNFLVGAELPSQQKTQTINKIEIFLIDGDIKNLKPGLNNSVELVIDKQNYIIYKAKDISIENETIDASKLIELTYKITAEPNNIELKPNQSKQITTKVVTNPEGLESFFQDTIKFTSKNPKIASVTEDGIVKGKDFGKTEIQVDFLDDTDIVNVTVIGFEIAMVSVAVVFLIVFIMLIWIIGEE